MKYNNSERLPEQEIRFQKNFQFFKLFLLGNNLRNKINYLDYSSMGESLVKMNYYIRIVVVCSYYSYSDVPLRR